MTAQGEWQARDSRDISDEEGTDDGKPRDKKRKEVMLVVFWLNEAYPHLIGSSFKAAPPDRLAPSSLDR